MESLGVLAGGVAHDLNNVLSGIVSYPDLLLMDLPEGSPLRAPIETIKESGQKAATIVQDLLTLARRGVSASEVLDLNRLIEAQQGSAEYQKLLTYYPDIRIAFELADDLPNIKGSSVHLNKTFMNLISNAAEAQPNGGEIIVITQGLYMDRAIRGYDTVKAGEYVRLRVKDRGEGISKTDLNHIFEPFYTKKKMGRSGTGLGLAVVWGTVQDHGAISMCTANRGKAPFSICTFRSHGRSSKKRTRNSAWRQFRVTASVFWWWTIWNPSVKLPPTC
jgi:two-component system cell cycle sensor histidine kinase/response regulator CckA